jgi:hypothetical protein
MILLFLVFQGTSALLSIVVALINTSTKSMSGFLFPHIFPVVVCVFDGSHFDWSEV